MERARLTRYGLLSVTGDDARDFLHAQLTNDIQNLPAGSRRARRLVLGERPPARQLSGHPAPHGFLLQLARDLAPAVAKRLSMFVLRSKVKIADESDAWAQFGVWGGRDAPDDLDAVCERQRDSVAVGERTLPASRAGGRRSRRSATAPRDTWTLEEIRAGRPLITARHAGPVRAADGEPRDARRRRLPEGLLSRARRSWRARSTAAR